MGKGHKKSLLAREQARAWKFYQAWRQTGSTSPAFNGEQIYITRLGWNHLVDPRKRRNQKEKIRRFRALPLAKKIIEISTTFQELRRDGDISYWAFVATIGGQQIKVVLSARGKKKQFLSVIVMK